MYYNWIRFQFFEMFTLSFGSWIHRMSAGGLPTTSHDSVTSAPLSASTDFGRLLNTGPSNQ